MLSGCDILIDETETVSNVVVTSESELNNAYYIWHNDYTNNVMEDVGGNNSGYGSFTKLYKNYSTIVETVSYSNTANGHPENLIWLSEEELELVPTYYYGDALVLSAETYRPVEIIFERYFDEGWTFGICGLTADATGRYSISTEADPDGKSLFFPLAESYEIARELPETTIMIDKVGGSELRSNGISDSGFIKGLKKDAVYELEIYIGTISYNIKLRADAKALVSRECFVSTEYSLVNSKTAIIKIPEYLKTGYYYVDGEGLFRYIAAGDSWEDGKTNFNSPICYFDEEGNVIHDPSKE